MAFGSVLVVGGPPVGESNVLKGTILELSKNPDYRFWRNNVGMAWQGSKLVWRKKNLLIVDAHPVTFGLCPGSHDLVGLKSVVITPDMVGQRVAVFSTIETKRPKGGVISTQQKNFATVIRSLGGLSVFAKKPADAVDGLQQMALGISDTEKDTW